MGAPDPADPFAIFTQPPPNETPEQRLARVARETEEKRVSDRIDEQIKQDRAAMKKKDKNTVKVLLLGQSESGKSTTLKNFRLKYAKAAWKAERQSWKSVVQLNLIRSILTILDTLQSEADGDPLPPFPTSSLQLQAYPYNFAQNPSTRTSHQSRPSTDTQDSAVTIEKPEEVLESRQRIQLAEKHQVLRRRLGPLRRVEQDLKRRLGAGTDEVFFNGTTTGVLGSSGVLEESTNRLTESPKEFGVRGWKAAFSSSTAGSSSGQADNGSDEASDIIAQCREDMIALWEDQTVKQVLKRRRMRIEDAAGFYLNDLDRIATRGYEPSDDDIIRARLRTLGVQEHRIQFDQSVQNTAPGILGNMGLGPDFGHEWILYDVGGSRTSRHAWLPYFEGVNAIIFLAPISCFDERLLEDPSVNRLEDSFILWSAVCANKLLAKSTIILFLNKCDILKKKLKAGIQVKNFLPSYGERPNEASAVLKYLKDKFKDLSRLKSPEPRVSYFYATSVTDTRATATTLKTVRDSILREHLKNADLLM